MLSKQPINDKILPKRSQKTFYNFAMLDIFPKVLIRFSKLKGQAKYFSDKPGFRMWYKMQVKACYETGDFIGIIIYSILALLNQKITEEIDKNEIIKPDEKSG